MGQVLIYWDTQKEKSVVTNVKRQSGKINMWVRIRADQLEMNNNIIEHVTSLKPVVESNVHLLKYSALKRSSL